MRNIASVVGRQKNQLSKYFQKLELNLVHFTRPFYKHLSGQPFTAGEVPGNITVGTIYILGKPVNV